MKQLVAAIVRAVVDHPERVEITEIVGESAHVFEVRVAPEDRGQIIGRRGTTADAIRTLLVASGGKHRRRFMLEIIEEPQARRPDARAARTPPPAR